MTTIPKPADPTQSYTATYDAWNRLVEIVEGSNTVAKYAYDGAKRRTIKKKYAGGTLDETRHLFYTDPSRWQVVEVRINRETAPNRQFIWGLRYIDDILLRDRDTDDNGTLDERFFGLQDDNWNVTSITDATATIEERYAYTAYGVVRFMDGNFADRTASNDDWETTYAGYLWDEEAELFSVRNRFYASNIGLWVQRDPFSAITPINLYEYCNCSPTMLIDGKGLVPYPHFIPSPEHLKRVFLSWIETIGKVMENLTCPILIHPCFGQLIGCFCGIIDLTTIAVPGPASALANCFCGGVDLFGTVCNRAACPSQLLPKGMIEFTDCVVGFGGPGVLGLALSLELIELIIDTLAYERGGIPWTFNLCLYGATECAHMLFPWAIYPVRKPGW